MNKVLEQFARNTIKEGLAKCTEAEVLMFKRMYSHGKLEKDINDVVDDMPVDKLDWAMEQVQRTNKKRELTSS